MMDLTPAQICLSARSDLGQKFGRLELCCKPICGLYDCRMLQIYWPCSAHGRSTKIAGIVLHMKGYRPSICRPTFEGELWKDACPVIASALAFLGHTSLQSRDISKATYHHVVIMNVNTTTQSKPCCSTRESFLQMLPFNSH